MAITFDPRKRDWTLANRGLDFADAERVLAGTVLEFEDDRFDYDEIRMIAVGLLNANVVVVGYASRGEDQHVFTMRHATKGESDEYFESVG
ncbi:MAG: BrnT family toxin [Pseudomonadota bacterium]